MIPTVLFSMLLGAAATIEYTRGFALATSDEETVGFVLAAPTFAAASGDCVFMLLPERAGLVDSPLGIAISERKVAGEHHWKKRDGAIVVERDGRVVWTIRADGEIRDGTGQPLGVAFAVPE